MLTEQMIRLTEDYFITYSGFLIKFGNNTVNWESRKQRCVALSSTEAEYLAIGDACKDVLLNVRCLMII